MGITHAKVSAVSDGGDTTLVQPSDWNATHAVGSYIGYNTIGGSWITISTRQQICKPVTLAGNTQFLSIDAYLRPSTDQTSGLAVTVLQDNAGAPGVLVAGNTVTMYLSNSSSMPGAARWVSVPLTAYLAAGDYWICVMCEANRYDMAYDGSGGDKYFIASLFLATGGYPTAWAITTTTDRYSIRARIL